MRCKSVSCAGGHASFFAGCMCVLRGDGGYVRDEKEAYGSNLLCIPYTDTQSAHVTTVIE